MSDTPNPAVFRVSKDAPAVPMIWASVATVKTSREKQFKAEPRYEATFLIPPNHPELPALKAAMKSVATAEWGSDLKGVQWAAADGDARAEADAAKGKKRDYFRGQIVVTAHASKDYPPELVVPREGQYVPVGRDEAARKAVEPMFYSGVLTKPTLKFKAYAMNGNKYVTAYINEVCTENRGEKIAASVDMESRYGKPETFADYRGTTRAGANPAGAELDDDLPI